MCFPGPLMWFALAVAVFSVALGAGLAFVPGIGSRTLGALRLLAFLAVSAVLAVHLFPDAFGALGLRAIAGILAGLLIPAAIVWVAKRSIHAPGARRESSRRLATEIGYFGLLVHHVGDGLGLWTFSRPEARNLEVVFALAAHSLPIAMVVVLHFLPTHGRRAAALRAMGLALAGCVGVLLGWLVPSERFSSAEPWISAMVSGLLLHVVLHELSTARRAQARDPIHSSAEGAETPAAPEDLTRSRPAE